jgi:hypothetical protein
LDLLIFGVIPESLLPVIGYAFAVSLFAWLVVGRIVVRLVRSAVHSGELKELDGNRQKTE